MLLVHNQRIDRIMNDYKGEIEEKNEAKRKGEEYSKPMKKKKSKKKGRRNQVENEEIVLEDQHQQVV